MPVMLDHSADALSKVQSAVPMGLDWRMCACRLAVAAADARKAEDASDTTERTPRPPYLAGKLACSHCPFVRSTLQILPTADLSCLSNRSSNGLPLQCAALSVNSRRGALSEFVLLLFFLK
jgi:hypothetical protein